MRCYIYFIINKITKERYVGQTTNFSRRKNEHLSKLQENIHPNKKLQNAYNKYGKENFIFQKILYEDITKKELDQYEIYYISKYNSFNNGYNLTIGGTGGNCRSKLNFEQYCFAYFGNIKYDGMTNRTGKYLNVDSSCISSIKAKKSYDSFREKAEKLPQEEKDRYLKDFENKMEIYKNTPWTKRPTPEDDISLEMLCVCSTYGRGIESAILKKFNLSKGYIFHIMRGNGRQELKNKYKNMSQLERITVGKQKFEEWKLQKYSKLKLKEQYRDLVEYYGCEPKSS